MKNKKASIALHYSLVLAFAGLTVLFVYFPRQEPDRAGIAEVAFVEDAEGKLTAPDILGPEGALRSPNDRTVAPLRHPTIFWATLTVGTAKRAVEPRYLSVFIPSLTALDAYFPDGTSCHLAAPLALGEQADSRAIFARALYLPIPDSVTSGSRVALRVRSRSASNLSLAVMGAGAMVRAVSRDTLFFGLAFGALLAAILINALMYAVLRRRVFLIHAAYLAFLIVYTLSENGLLISLPLAPIARSSVPWLSLAGGMATLAVFTQRMTDLRARLPAINRILTAGIVAVVAFAPIGAFALRDRGLDVAKLTGAGLALILLAAVVFLEATGKKNHRLYLIAWCVLAFVSLVGALSPFFPTALSTARIFIMGGAIASILFSLSVIELVRSELRETEEIKEREKYYITLSHTDSLTGLYNRRYLSELVTRLEEENEIPAVSSLLMLDLDDFKAINDTYGHLVGDILLTKTGSTIKRRIRHTDIACRYGGDEFLVFLPGASLSIAQNIAECIRDEVLTAANYSETGEPIAFTISIGLTETRLEDSFDAMFLRADAALYQAKKLGRNRVTAL